MATDPKSGRAYAVHEIQQGNGSNTNNDTVLPTYRNNNGSSSPSESQHDGKDGKEVVDLSTVEPPHEEEHSEKSRFTQKLNEYAHFKRPFFHAALVLFGLAWWICTIILNRDYWIPVTVIVWFAIGLIFFQYCPTTVFSRPIERTWTNTVEGPWFKLHYYVRLALGWTVLVALVFGSAFGFPLEPGTSYGQRAQSIFGLFVFQLCFWLSSRARKAIQWQTVIVGLVFQQALALFVLRSGAGFAIFNWIAQLASDFLTQAYYGSAFFVGNITIGDNPPWSPVFDGFWFLTNTLGAIIFFIAFAEMMYYYGVLQWLIAKLGWFFLKTMNISGAEAVVAAASPFIGQGESACMVKPYVNTMTSSEIHQTLTSGFATIAGSVLAAYIGFGMPAVYLVTSAVMSIPASIAISKLRWPETEEPLTRGKITVARDDSKAQNALHAFSNGAWFGLRVAGLILCNVLTIIALVTVINGVLNYIGRSFNITPEHTSRAPLSLELIFSYLFYPLAWLMGVPKPDLLTVAGLLGTKLVQNEFVAFLNLSQLQPTMTARGYNIAVYALCGFGNLGSLGIQIGVLSALGPARKSTIVKCSVSALACGFLATCQTAGIAGQLL